MREINILVACEESQAVTKELRRLGHRAFSCDLEPCSGGHPEWHIQGDCLPFLNNVPGPCGFRVIHTQDNQQIILTERWDMILAFPPCTYLTASSGVRLYNKDHTIKDWARYQKGLAAAAFFRAFLECDCNKVAVENPVQLKLFALPHPDQRIEPYFFGDPWRKRTCLWLRGLPKLTPTNIVEPKGLWVGSTSARRVPDIHTRYDLHSNRDPKRRAKTFPGVARAMAEQWAGELWKGA